MVWFTFVMLYKRMKRDIRMISQEQIDMLVDLYGLEWVDYVEYIAE